MTRQVSNELLPCLRKLGIRFYAYNPLAGGLLTGKYSEKVKTSEGRFHNVSFTTLLLHNFHKYLFNKIRLRFYLLFIENHLLYVTFYI